MATLELLTFSPPYTFKSLGVEMNRGKFDNTTDFPTNREYILTAGFFPLRDYNDMYEHSKRYHTLKDNTTKKEIEIKITGFDTHCQIGQINEYDDCRIIVEKVNDQFGGGRKKKNIKNKTNRKKLNRRKSNRRKSNRRKSNRRKFNDIKTKKQ